MGEDLWRLKARFASSLVLPESKSPAGPPQKSAAAAQQFLEQRSDAESHTKPPAKARS